MQTTRKWILSICSNTLQHTSRDIEQVSPCVHTTGKTCWGLNIPKPQLHMKYPTRLYHYRPTSSRTANCFCRFAVATLSALTIPSEITYISPYSGNLQHLHPVPWMPPVVSCPRNHSHDYSIRCQPMDLVLHPV